MRASGILMHITSLPGSYGVGTLGKSAFSFVDFLKKSGQTLWQLLPLNPTGYGDSPYQSYSAFAGNHYLIDLENLVEQGLLTQAECGAVNWGEDAEKVDFGALYNHRTELLQKAWDRFTDDGSFTSFCTENSAWLSDFALYMAIKKEQGTAWYNWPEELKLRQADAIWAARRRLEKDVRFYSFLQYLFFTQWQKLKDYAAENNIRIIGDVPIYVPYDSVEVWVNPELFQLDEKLQPEAVAGCPPDAFSEDGQLWGNPLYRWDVHRKDGYSWWLRRMAAAQKLFDIVRLDHFRGFEAYWSIPYGDNTARGGKWMKGPGMDFIKALQKGLPKLELIAEDLGFLTPEVLALRDDANLPGMKVLGFAFDSRDPSDYLPYNYPQNCVCYTGTHDNMTTRQWFDTAPKDAVSYAAAYMSLSKKEGYVWGVIRTAMASPAKWSVVPMQDFLNLGKTARMNFPGTASGNWTWRMEAGALTPALSEKIYNLTKLYGRINNPKKGETA